MLGCRQCRSRQWVPRQGRHLDVCFTLPRRTCPEVRGRKKLHPQLLLLPALLPCGGSRAQGLCALSLPVVGWIISVSWAKSGFAHAAKTLSGSLAAHLALSLPWADLCQRRPQLRAPQGEVCPPPPCPPAPLSTTPQHAETFVQEQESGSCLDTPAHAPLAPSRQGLCADRRPPLDRLPSDPMACPQGTEKRGVRSARGVFSTQNACISATLSHPPLGDKSCPGAARTSPLLALLPSAPPALPARSPIPLQELPQPTGVP